ncbi:MAG: hypothetical protein DWQ29_07970, partial [Planctomycetota bacterium]
MCRPCACDSTTGDPPFALPTAVDQLSEDSPSEDDHDVPASELNGPPLLHPVDDGAPPVLLARGVLQLT